jgi:2'-hydroxyisoflavone reductase
MKLLILGGTRFLGHHLVAAARARQHAVTLFHRGTHGVAADAQVETILGDRNRDLARLRGRQWDAVIDTCGYLPDSLRASAGALAAAAGQYVFISSVSVYAELRGSGVDETAPVAELTGGQLQQANAIDASGTLSAGTFGPLYGGLKVLCERAAEEVLPDRVLTVRPGLIVGARDYTDRFTYWPARVARGGEVLAPGRPQRYVQFIDVRDLAEWIVAMVERRQTGIFNATGPAETVTMAALLESCRGVSGSDARFTWVPEPFLLGRQVAPWTELPLWLPEEGESRRPGLMAIDSRKAVAAGLRYRSLEDTVCDVLRWYRDEEQGRDLRAGLPSDRELQILREWHHTAEQEK